MAYNKVILIGNMVADPELKITPGDKKVTSFSLAVQRTKDQTDFLDIVCWQQTAEFVCRNFKKGQQILLEGSIQKRSYDAKDGSKRYITEVVATDAHFCGKKETAAPEALDEEGLPW